jgi:hypothetical protein
MIRSYCLLTIFVLSFADPTENAVQLPNHENLVDDWYWVTFRFILVGKYALAFFVPVLLSIYDEDWFYILFVETFVLIVLIVMTYVY